jgi:hypothetical protein
LAESFRSRAAQRVGDTVVAVAGEGRQVAGFVMVVADEVEQVYVSTAHRGSGVAGLLLAEAERLVAVAGHRRAWLAVVAGNTRARRFYERCGWADDELFDYAAAIWGGRSRCRATGTSSRSDIGRWLAGDRAAAPQRVAHRRATARGAPLRCGSSGSRPPSVWHAGTMINQPPDDLPRYRVLTGPDDETFCRRVSEALDLGFHLHEGPALTYNGERVIVAQALVWPWSPEDRQ